MNDRSDQSERMSSGPQGLAASTGRGVAYAGVSVVCARFSSLIAQVVLGWLLAKDDFAVFAVAIGISQLAEALKHGGVLGLFQQRPNDFPDLIAPGVRVALSADLVIMGVMAVIALPMAHFYGMAELAPMLWIAAASVLLSLPGLRYRGAVARTRQFKEAAIADGSQAVARAAFAIVFALLGFGPLSFVMGLPVVAILDWLILRRWVVVPTGTISGAIGSRDLLKPAFWILVATVGTVLLSGTIEYLVLGRMFSEDMLANYFFGFQLTLAVSTLFAGSVRSVLMPSFGALAEDPARQTSALTRSLNGLTVSTSIALLLGSAIASPLIEVIWQGKWDGAGFVAMVLLAVLPARLNLLVARSFIEARGKWSLSALFTWTEGLGSLVVTIVLALQDRLDVLVIGIGIYKLVMALLILGIIARMAPVPLLRLANVLLVPYVTGIVCVAISVWLQEVAVEWNVFLRILLGAVSFLVSYVVLAAVFMRRRHMETFRMAKGIASSR